MAQNPYQSPGARVEDLRSHDFSWKAAWAGAAMATGTAYLIASFLSPIFQWYYLGRGTSFDDLYVTMTTAPEFVIVSLALSAVAYFIGGRVIAVVASQRRIYHSVVAGAICMLAGAVLYLGVYPPPFPMWAQVLGFALTIPCFALGASRHDRNAQNAI